MNKSVPTLLGVMIILMVVVLVVLMYDFRLTTKLASGEIPVGTVGGRAITGAEEPAEQISPYEALAARGSGEKQTLSADQMQRRQARMESAGEGQERQGRRAGSQARKQGRAPGSGEAKPETD